MIAVLSDIHGNLEALTAVLDDIARHGNPDIYCLGDLVGYGPNPRECVDAAMQFHVTLMGNHDEAIDRQAELDLDEFGPEAQRFLDWTRLEVEATIPDVQRLQERTRFLSALPLTHRNASTLFVHGGPNDPTHQYVFPMDRHNEPKMEAVFAEIGHICFHGHTHLPGIMTESLRFHRPHEIVDGYEITEEKLLCNTGSVGLSRDKDSRATYVLFDGRTIQFRRVSFDIDTTRIKLNELEQRLPQL